MVPAFDRILLSPNKAASSVTVAWINLEDTVQNDVNQALKTCSAWCCLCVESETVSPKEQNISGPGWGQGGGERGMCWCTYY